MATALFVTPAPEHVTFLTMNTRRRQVVRRLGFDVATRTRDGWPVTNPSDDGPDQGRTGGNSPTADAAAICSFNGTTIDTRRFRGSNGSDATRSNRSA